MAVEILLENRLVLPDEECRSVNYTKLDDHGLWYAITTDDLAALAFVYKRFYEELYFYGVKLTGNETLVEDCIQDLFLKLWEKRRKIRIKKALKPYLYRMFRSMLMDELRSIRTKEHPLDEGTPLLFDWSVQDWIIEREMAQQTQEMLEKALAGLSNRQKEIIYLRFYEEMGYQEISELLQIRYQSVRNGIHEAMKALKAAIKLNMLIVMMLLTGLF